MAVNGPSPIIIELAPSERTVQAVVMGYPLRMPPALLLRHPQVEEAIRCTRPALRDETCQVLVTLCGPLFPSLDLGC